jgi:hypothetical protein
MCHRVSAADFVAPDGQDRRVRFRNPPHAWRRGRYNIKVKYFSLFVTLWLLFYAGRGTVPASISRHDRDTGTPMRRSTRVIFLLGGLLIGGLTFLLFYKPRR